MIPAGLVAAWSIGELDAAVMGAATQARVVRRTPGGALLMATLALERTSLTAALGTIVGDLHVITDADERRFFSQDVFSQGTVCELVVRPGTRDELARAAAAVTCAGRDLIARGGGMSYTGGYLPVREASVVVDLSRLDRIVEINQTDMYATVEAGCTWATLHAALEPLGLKTPYWGPLSGLRSTVGGALSQNSVFFGSGLHGSAADTVIGLEVVLADGSVVTTGSAGGRNANAFTRHYGPDLTGLFTGDAGAFGIKATATLRLVRRLPARRYASFAFDQRAGLLAAMMAMAREGLATECFAFDPYLQSVRMKRASLLDDAKVLGAVVRGQASLGRGLREGLRMAMAGRRFADGVDWPLHVAIEERGDAAAEAALAEVRRLALGAGGRETENTVPKAVHAAPFGPMNGMLGAEGERWVPVHGVLPNSRVAAFMAILDDFQSRHAAEMAERRISMGYLMTSVGPGATLIEPVFYWPDARMEIHDRSVDAALLARLPCHAADEAARAAVVHLRAEVVALLSDHGAIHYQVGKTYPWLETRSRGAADLARSLKAVVDPLGKMNPGALGLP